jgi:hypothetical protein
MTQEEKMQKEISEITEIVAIIPQMQKRLEEVWKWVSGENGFEEGAADILRRHEELIQESIATKKSNKRLIAEKVAYLLTGGLLVILTKLFAFIWG